MRNEIRQLDAEDCARMVDWAAVEGWNPGVDDAAAFHSTDPEGFWGLFEDKELVATISAVRYGHAFAFVGFYICRPDRRGRGFGRRLWNHVLGTLDAATIGLDGVVDQQDNYRQSGFMFAHRNVRFGGRPVLAAVDDRRLRRLGRTDLPIIDAFEREHRVFPAARSAFNAAWLAMQDAVAFGLDSGGSLTGYGVIRPCRSGWKIGPLFAKGEDDAMCLAQALIAETAGATVFLDPPEPNAAALRLVAALGLEPAFETARMYRGPAPDLAIDTIFGITSFELG